MEEERKIVLHGGQGIFEQMKDAALYKYSQLSKEKLEDLIEKIEEYRMLTGITSLTKEKESGPKKKLRI